MYAKFVQRLIQIYTGVYSISKVLNTDTSLEENKRVVKMVEMIIEHHVANKTKFKRKLSSKIRGVAELRSECEKSSECRALIGGDAEIANIAKLLDYMFFAFKTFLSQLKEAINEFDDPKVKLATNFAIVKNIDLVFYFLFLNTSVIPIVSPEEFHKVMNIDGDKEFMLINKCKTVLRKYSNDFYICDFNPKLDYTSLSPSKTFFDRAHDYLQWKKASSPLRTLFSDNIPVNSPRAALILTAIIVSLRNK